MQLFDHQKKFVSSKRKKAILVWGTGTGKSKTSIAWAMNNRTDQQKSTPVLVICPKYLKKKWEAEFISFAGDKEEEELIKGSLDTKIIRIISKEEFRRDWDKLQAYGSVIVDEAHYFAGIKSQMSKNLGKYIKKHNTQFILGLTATPFLSSPLNIYTLGKHLGMTGYTWSYMWFMQTFYDQVTMGMRTVPMIKKNIESILAMKVREIADIVDMKDCVDLPDENHIVEYYSMTHEQERGVKAIQEVNHLTRWTKIHQICGGHLKGDEYNEPKEFKSDKFNRALELIAENKKAIVVTRYVGESEMLAREIISSSDPAFSSKKVLMINGDVKDKQAVLDEANASDDCVLLVTAACSEGWEAPTFNTMIFYSYDFSLKNYIQMKGRIQRINAIQKCAYISLIMEKTIDEDVYKNVAVKKTDFHLSIYKKDMSYAVSDSAMKLAQELADKTGEDVDKILESLVDNDSGNLVPSSGTITKGFMVGDSTGNVGYAYRKDKDSGWYITGSIGTA